MKKIFMLSICLLFLALFSLSAQGSGREHMGLWAGTMVSSSGGNSIPVMFLFETDGRFEYQFKSGSYQGILSGSSIRSGDAISIKMSTATGSLRSATIKNLMISGSTMNCVFIDSLHPEISYTCNLTKKK